MNNAKCDSFNPPKLLRSLYPPRLRPVLTFLKDSVFHRLNIFSFRAKWGIRKEGILTGVELW